MPLVIVAIFFIVLFSCEGIEHLCRESDDQQALRRYMSITPARPATIISICSVNSRFPLDFEQIIGYTKSVIPHAGVVELADARDSKSRVRKDVRVRPPPPAPNQGFQFSLESFNFSLYYKEKSTQKNDNQFKRI